MLGDGGEEGQLLRIDLLIKTMLRELRQKSAEPDAGPEEANFGPDEAFGAKLTSAPEGLDDQPF